MILKKKELIAASLVILIGVAGYLNWSYQDTINVRDGESYIETGKKLGEAQYVSSVGEVEDENEEAEETAAEDAAADVSEDAGGEEAAVETVNDSGGYFEQARLDKETSRSKSLEILNQTAANESFDAQIRQKAGDKIIAAADNIEKESAIESVAQSKGYPEICVYIEDGTANVSVRKDGFSQEDASVLTEIITSQTDLSAQDIRITEVR